MHLRRGHEAGIRRKGRGKSTGIGGSPAQAGFGGIERLASIGERVCLGLGLASGCRRLIYRSELPKGAVMRHVGITDHRAEQVGRFAVRANAKAKAEAVFGPAGACYV